MAYPILEQAGVLAKTRLKEPAPARPHGRNRNVANGTANGSANGKSANGDANNPDWQKRKPRSA